MTIQSRLSVEQRIAELKRSAVSDTLFGRMLIPAGSILCKLSGNRFRLSEKRSYGNAYARFFYGELRPTAFGTEIEGKFRLSPFVLAFMSLWFGMLLLFVLLATVSMVVEVFSHRILVHGANPSFLLGVLCMGVIGYSMLRFGGWLARNEEKRITQFLQATFGDTPPTTLISADKMIRSPTPVMWLGVLFFAVLGALSVAGGLSGISSYSSTLSNGLARTTITHFDSSWGRVAAVANGIFLLLMAYGVGCRLRICWKMGFFFFAWAALIDVGGFSGSHPNIPQVLGLAVGAYWVTWWYKKRDYFTE